MATRSLRSMLPQAPARRVLISSCKKPFLSANAQRPQLQHHSSNAVSYTAALQLRRYATTPERPDTTSSSAVPASSPESPQQPPRKLPKWAQKYADRLKNHPGSHITSFLILHEITAVLPLPLLFWLFHSFDWTPESIVTTPEIVEKGAKLAAKQLERFGLRYTGDDETRYIFEGAAAYAVVKVMLPLRIGLSLWLMPAFARRVVVPVTNLFRRKKAAAVGSGNGPGVQ